MPDSSLRLAMQEMPDKGKKRGESKLAKRTPLLLATSWGTCKKDNRHIDNDE
jgi:hypothetical protein